MSHETLPPSLRESAMANAQELAGGLQRIWHDLPNRELNLDFHQEVAVEVIGRSLATGTAEGHVEMATGTGKTVLISLLAEAAAAAGKRTLILAPSLAIADSLVGEDRSSGLGQFTSLVNDNQVGIHYGGRHARRDKSVVVSTYAGLLNEVGADNQRLGNFDLILADECHRSLGPETSKAMGEYMPGAVRIGFSATPNFAEDRKSEEVFGDSIYEFSLRRAIETGVTAPVRALLYQTDSKLKLTDKRSDFTDKELAPLMNLMDRNGAAVQLAVDLVASGRRGIMRCVPGGNNAHARLLANMVSSAKLGDRSIIALDIGGHLDVSEQKKRLASFNRGECDVLTFTQSIGEGWDSDKARFCVNLAPSSSPLVIKQLLGRILRRGNDDLDSIFVDFVDDTLGIAKKQYTALHALDEQVIDVTRVIGTQKNITGRHANTIELEKLFDPAMYARFMRNQGKLLQEVVVNQQVKNPLFEIWGKMLDKEGLSVKAGSDELSPAESAAYNQSVDMLVAALGRLPLHAEVVSNLHESSDLLLRQIEKITNFALRHSLDEFDADTLIAPYEHVEDDVLFSALRENLETVLYSLSKRERQILELNYGLSTPSYDNPMMHEEIGRMFGISRSRIWQVRNDSLLKLLHSPRSRLLKDFIGEKVNLVPSNEIVPTQTDAPQSIEEVVRSVQVNDKHDRRKYITRLEAMAQKWLVMQPNSIARISEQWDDEQLSTFLKDNPGVVSPIGYTIYGKLLENVGELHLYCYRVQEQLSSILKAVEERKWSYSTLGNVNKDMTLNLALAVLMGGRPYAEAAQLMSLKAWFSPQYLMAEITRNLVYYESLANSLKSAPDSSQDFSYYTDLGRITYSKEAIVAQAMKSELPALREALEEAHANHRRIYDRWSYSETTEQRQASLVIAETNVKNIERKIAAITVPWFSKKPTLFQP